MTALLNKWLKPNGIAGSDSLHAPSRSQEVAAGRNGLRPVKLLECNEETGKVAESQKSQGGDSDGAHAPTGSQKVAAGRRALRPESHRIISDLTHEVAKSQKSQGGDDELRALARLGAEAAGMPTTPEYLDHVVKTAKLFETTEPDRPCPRCGGRHFWRESMTNDPWRCYRCVPPLPTVWADCCCLPKPR